MCGVIGLVYERQRQDLGRIAAELLETLEYRGYDSTGAAIQGDGLAIDLRKGVGAPSVMVHELGITELAGQVLCGQVRWATFGAVDDRNAQPHVMDCKELLYGAHNGNVTNCDDLKGWLTVEGHTVLSDNDGEMVVHTIEHLFAEELDRLDAKQRPDPDLRNIAMRQAISRAAARFQGSYAAVVVDPVTRTVYAIKKGSSLYCGQGEDELGGKFHIASSDLSAVLKLTRVLIPLVEGEFVEMTAERIQLFRLEKDPESAPTPLSRNPVRSRLRAQDTALLPPYETYMDQEISSQEDTCREVITLFQGGSASLSLLRPVFEKSDEEVLARIHQGLELLRAEYDDKAIEKAFHALVDLPVFRQLVDGLGQDLLDELRPAAGDPLAAPLMSSEAGLLADLLPMARGDRDRLSVRLMDALLEKDEVDDYEIAVSRFVALCEATQSCRGRIFVLSCGSSYHAARAAALFFNEVAHAELLPVLPGEFRGQFRRTVQDGDLFLAVSQSGETKDLIDVLNDVRADGKDVQCVAVVNNVNSTLAQEKCDLVIPLRCGAEIAVPATKSYTNQLVLFYCLALRLAELRLASDALPEAERVEMAADLHRRQAALPGLPALMKEAAASNEAADGVVQQVAEQLFLCPSIQVLATRIIAVALEGALKIREVVLNHTEGCEASEFKHGPNTILGFNTVLGPREVDALVKQIGRTVDGLLARAVSGGMSGSSVRRLVQTATDAVFDPGTSTRSLDHDERTMLKESYGRGRLLRAVQKDYPLIFVTGPDERDVRLTISQINTHKIRGASTYVIAEPDGELARAASKSPADNPRYRSAFIPLPATGDSLMTVFTATIVLQRLALKMSLLKKEFLDRVGIPDHGVHPDVPKNVSKSITVD